MQRRKRLVKKYINIVKEAAILSSSYQPDGLTIYFNVACEQIVKTEEGEMVKRLLRDNGSMILDEDNRITHLFMNVVINS